MKSLYCTADRISMESGGGAATVNELEALRSVSDDVFVLSRDNINPELFKQSPESPFLWDYFALQQVKDKHFNLAHFYSWTFSATVRYLKDHGTKVSYMVAAHDRKTSVDEFHRLGLEYPFYHISDDRLFEIYSEGYRLADIVFTQSHKSVPILQEMGCKNIKVMPGGIVWPKEVKPPPEKFRVGYTGAYGPDKGVRYLIESWSLLNYSDAELVLSGMDAKMLEPFVKTFAKQGNFILPGRVADVADFYNAISVYVQPAVTTGFDLEVPEAMSYGKSVIVTEGTGASDLITDGEQGFVVPIRSPEAIAEKIEWLRKNPFERGQMGGKARRKARNYTWSTIRKMYAKVFLGLGGN